MKDWPSEKLVAVIEEDLGGERRWHLNARAATALSYLAERAAVDLTDDDLDAILGWYSVAEGEAYAIGDDNDLARKIGKALDARRAASGSA